MGLLRGDHYEAEVNKGSLNVRAFTAKLNGRWKQGWALAHVFEQDKNTVMVWERHGEGDEQEAAAPPAPLPPPPSQYPPPPTAF